MTRGNGDFNLKRQFERKRPLRVVCRFNCKLSLRKLKSESFDHKFDILTVK